MYKVGDHVKLKNSQISGTVLACESYPLGNAYLILFADEHRFACFENWLERAEELEPDPPPRDRLGEDSRFVPRISCFGHR